MVINISEVWGQIAPHAMKYLLLMVAIAMDIITGIFTAIKNKDFQSSKMRSGLNSKIGEIGSVIFGEIVNSLANYSNTELPINFSSMIITYIILMELGSIAENLGFVLPEEITKYFPNKKE